MLTWLLHLIGCVSCGQVPSNVKEHGFGVTLKPDVEPVDGRAINIGPFRDQRCAPMFPFDQVENRIGGIGCGLVGEIHPRAETDVDPTRNDPKVEVRCLLTRIAPGRGAGFNRLKGPDTGIERRDNTAPADETLFYRATALRMGIVSFGIRLPNLQQGVLDRGPHAIDDRPLDADPFALGIWTGDVLAQQLDGMFEIHTCRQLADRYSTSRVILQQILNRMVDLHEIASKCVVMPVESYSLKHMAKWQGFSWRQDDAGGAQAVYWYAQWLKTGDRSYLDASVTYNEDDCLATYHLKRWLERWEADHYPTPVTSLARCEIPAS